MSSELRRLEDIHDDDRSTVRGLMHDGELATGIRQFEFVFKRAPRHVGDSSADDRPEPLSMTFDELVGDRPAFDRAVRATMLAADLDYVPAMERLESWFALSGEHRAEPPTLGEVVPDMRSFGRDLHDFADREAAAEEAIVNDDSITPDPGGEVNGKGEVLLGSADEGATLLTDDHAQEAAYLNAVWLGQAESGEEGRREFDELLRMSVEAGVNWPATLQRGRRERELAARRHQAADRSLSSLDGKRRKRAEERAAADALEEAQKRARIVRRHL